MPAEPLPPVEPDLIQLRGVTATGHHGVLAHERRDGQPFVVDLDLAVDLRRAAATDELADTVSYAEVAAAVVRVVEGPPLDLIEALAGRVADTVLAAHPPVQAVTVTVHKPQAPVGVAFDDVTVRLRRERDVPAVVALGANLGRPAAAVRRAVRALGRAPGVHRVRVSPLVDSDPVGGPEQPAFVNAVALVRTRLPARELLTVLHAIEQDAGRTREVRWGPRTLDLDLVQYGTPGAADEVRSDEPGLQLPHPRAHERAFVLLPWHRLDPDARLRLKETVAPVGELLSGLDTSGVRERPRRRQGQRR
ncbi:2-amino-4-hydroxy-6-hydroxymethyldihydropteridine diphosphokinase [Ornithinicoccus halotolerans]|uniref:2-amino-4-hydroxy-6- hydroxymethyldihydropteridine diphosphokinase n=1 Tax=Ornithinicoccus halotolerans TaxID=1748220 RepID=UPI00129576DE|nr:2-amino-4-hydroxy-6-hydroxymethyldihydropteridine diphosphokinase [Ornithinicoccus halotolerans]